MADTNDAEIIKEFLVESHENLDQLDRDLLALETDPTARDRLAAVFRTIHTIKGTSGFLGFARLEALTHVGENLLSRLRDGELRLDARITSELLRMVDAVRRMLARIEVAQSDGDEDHRELIESLTRCCSGGRLVAVEPAPSATPLLTAPTAAPLSPVPTGAPHSPVPPRPDVRPLPAAERVSSAAEDPRSAASDASVRVDVGLLDKLMNLVGELVLARNQILQHASSTHDSLYQSTTQRLNIITTELQEGVMKTRMQPIGNVWNKLPRVVRDLARACGKEVVIHMEGKDTDLDRTILEAIKDPLTHVVRNAIDHGIESPQVRIAARKPMTGTLSLRAFHEGGQVNIEISDDGAGVDADKVRQRALQRGLISAERAQQMSDRDVVNLIFMPGFSTAERVTNVSGRGVGMDVVKTNIEKIGGTVDVQSRAGHGTVLKIKIPLTLAIIPALIVGSGGERFAIPQVSLLELVRLEGEQLRSGIERIHGAPVYRLRGKLLPLVYLSDTFNMTGGAGGSPEPEAVNIVVLQADDRQFGLVVDSVNDTEEIVVKPLGKELKSINVFAGATIMGDGRVALILDVLGIAQRGNVVSEVREQRRGGSGDKPAAGTDQRNALLLFRVADQERMAIPLSMVARLEEFRAASVERAGGLPVVQYRGEILPLIDLGSVLGRASAIDPRAETPLQVVVYSEHGRSVGLVVERILDIVDEVIAGTQRVHKRGVLGAAVIQGKVTDLLDVHGVIRSQDPCFFDSGCAA